MNTPSIKSKATPPSRIGKNVNGIYTAKNLKRQTSQRGRDYLVFDAQQDLLPVRAFIWVDHLEQTAQIYHGQRVKIDGRWMLFSGFWQIRCQQVKPVIEHEPLISQAKIRLRAMLSWMPDQTLRSFLLRIFRDPDIYTDFVKVPASRQHHHAFTGGLMVHSAEAAWHIFCQHSISSSDRTLGIVGSLLHDVGKIRTMSNHRQNGGNRFLNHDNLTLEILARHLAWLDGVDRAKSETIRHLLSWKPQSNSAIPIMDVYDMVKLADRKSAGGSIARKTTKIGNYFYVRKNVRESLEKRPPRYVRGVF